MEIHRESKVYVVQVRSFEDATFVSQNKHADNLFEELNRIQEILEFAIL